MHRSPLLLVALALVATACTSGRDEDGASTPDDEAVCTPARVEPDVPQVLRSGGEDRSYLLSVPGDPPTPGGFPLVISLHGHGSSAAEHEANTSLAAEARARGFVVATPDAVGEPTRWNFDRRAGGPDDYAFVAGLIDHLLDTACVDPGHVDLVGSSNGAAFAGLLACADETADVDVAAVAMVIATVPPTCPPDRRPSLLTIRGTADATVPYDATVAMVAAWADLDGCPDPPHIDEPSPGVTSMEYVGCAGPRQVAFLSVEGGAHVWPGSVRAARPGNSAASIDFPATDEILSFLAGLGEAS